MASFPWECIYSPLGRIYLCIFRRICLHCNAAGIFVVRRRVQRQTGTAHEYTRREWKLGESSAKNSAFLFIPKGRCCVCVSSIVTDCENYSKQARNVESTLNQSWFNVMVFIWTTIVSVSLTLFNFILFVFFFFSLLSLKSSGRNN